MKRVGRTVMYINEDRVVSGGMFGVLITFVFVTLFSQTCKHSRLELLPLQREFGVPFPHS